MRWMREISGCTARYVASNLVTEVMTKHTRGSTLRPKLEHERAHKVQRAAVNPEQRGNYLRTSKQNALYNRCGNTSCAILSSYDAAQMPFLGG